MAAGVRNLGVTLAIVAYFGFCTKQLDLSWVHDNFVPLLSAAVLFSFAMSVLLYLASFRRGTLLAKGGNTGKALRIYHMHVPELQFTLLEGCLYIVTAPLQPF